MWPIVNESKGKRKYIMKSQFKINDEKILNRIAYKFYKYFASNNSLSAGLEIKQIISFINYVTRSTVLVCFWKTAPTLARR